MRPVPNKTFQIKWEPQNELCQHDRHIPLREFIIPDVVSKNVAADFMPLAAQKTKRDLNVTTNINPRRVCICLIFFYKRHYIRVFFYFGFYLDIR